MSNHLPPSTSSYLSTWSGLMSSVAGGRSPSVRLLSPPILASLFPPNFCCLFPALVFTAPPLITDHRHWNDARCVSERVTALHGWMAEQADEEGRERGMIGLLCPASAVCEYTLHEGFCWIGGWPDVSPVGQISRVMSICTWRQRYLALPPPRSVGGGRGNFPLPERPRQTAWSCMISSCQGGADGRGRLQRQSKL